MSKRAYEEISWDHDSGLDDNAFEFFLDPSFLENGLVSQCDSFFTRMFEPVQSQISLKHPDQSLAHHEDDNPDENQLFVVVDSPPTKRPKLIDSPQSFTDAVFEVAEEPAVPMLVSNNQNQQPGLSHERMNHSNNNHSPSQIYYNNNNTSGTMAAVHNSTALSNNNNNVIFNNTNVNPVNQNKRRRRDSAEDAEAKYNAILNDANCSLTNMLSSIETVVAQIHTQRGIQTQEVVVASPEVETMNLSLSLCEDTPLPPVWYCDRPFPRLSVQVVNAQTGLAATNLNAEVCVRIVNGFGGDSTDQAYGNLAARSYQICKQSGRANIIGLRFSAVSSKQGGHFRIILSVHKTDPSTATTTTTPMLTSSSSPMSSCESYSPILLAQNQTSDARNGAAVGMPGGGDNGNGDENNAIGVGRGDGSERSQALCEWTSDPIQVLSYRLYHAPKVPTNQLQGEDSIGKMKGIGAQYAQRLKAVGIATVQDLANVDIEGMGRTSCEALLQRIRKDRGALTLAKLANYINQAREIVARSHDARPNTAPNPNNNKASVRASHSKSNPSLAVMDEGSLVELLHHHTQQQPVT
eukprot:c45806_g1_i1.p1 GENE.c45806_g1_i1~~c45806_g1_i1.p1  ORF type:complete len:615 (-),score=155.42 c45806_g1_i1:193-1929(-)